MLHASYARIVTMPMTIVETALISAAVDVTFWLPWTPTIAIYLTIIAQSVSGQMKLRNATLADPKWSPRVKHYGFTPRDICIHSKPDSADHEYRHAAEQGNCTQLSNVLTIGLLTPFSQF